MKSKNIIRKHADFVRVSACGVFARADFFILQFRKDSSYLYPRIGITASKRVGNAVIRNRCKRRLRALSGMLIPPDLHGDFVFIAKRGLESAPWNTLVFSVKNALRKVLSYSK